jgi:hypothetical protein
MKRHMIISWKWEGLNGKERIYYINNDDESLCHINCFNECDKVVQYIQNKCNEDSKILVLLHKTEPNFFVDECVKRISNESLPNREIFSYLFGQQKGHVYFNDKTKNGLIDPAGDFFYEDMESAIYVLSDSKIKKEYFDYVWNKYWIEDYLQSEKKKLIDSFMASIIDLQALSELNDENVRIYKEVAYNDCKERVATSFDLIKQGQKVFPELKFTLFYDLIEAILNPGSSVKQTSSEQLRNLYKDLIKRIREFCVDLDGDIRKQINEAHEAAK